ncbi:hypothetical protein [Nostoc sp. LEGE 12450]|uniref:hypothetical protein n=1 Tax=Nostoc sp. LEGE 12450 TaxID=1828643 RepID=UPI002AD4F4BD|nr:hypothetical protein [Nostoc sp. LEGE 12450]
MLISDFPPKNEISLFEPRLELCLSVPTHAQIKNLHLSGRNSPLGETRCVSPSFDSGTFSMPHLCRASKLGGNMNVIDINKTNFQARHLQEWLDSGVDQEIFHLNVKSLEGTTPYEYLLYSPNISRRNDGRLRDVDLKKYRHIEYGGW